MSILKVVKEQTVFNFTGKVNLLIDNNGKFVGSIFLKDGLVVNSFFGKFEGPEALLCVLQYDFLNIRRCKYIVEPEIIDSFHFAFRLGVQEIFEKWVNFQKLYDSCLLLRPSDSLKLRVSPKFIETGVKLSFSEHAVLQMLCDYPLIKDVYRLTKLPEYLITISLVSLRKKGALKVCKNT